MSAPIRIKDPNASGRLYTFSLSFGGMAALLTLLTLALSLFFVLGVLVGRGARPEAAVPVVAGMMPKESARRPAEVLKPEELGYGAQLGRTDGNTPARAIDSPRTAKAGAKAEAKAEERKAAEKLADKAATAKDKLKPEDKKGKPDQKPDPDSQRYDYAYQVATFPDPAAAKDFLKKVKGLGLKGDIESGEGDGKQWHRVVVFFQGTPTDTRALKDKLGGIGVQKFVMRSKTPI